MLGASGLFWQANHLDKFGIQVGQPSVDAAAFTGRSKEVVGKLRDGVAFLLKKRNIDVLTGHAKLTGTNSISIDNDGETVQIEAKNIIIATGSRAVRPDFLPWDCDALMTTDEAIAATDLPKSVIILGGGVIGCEFATIYSELGIPTTIVEMLDSLVANLDDDIVKAITDSLLERNANVLTATKIESVTPNKSGVVAKLSDGNTIEAEKLLVAVGRVPNTENLGIENLDIETNKGVIKVDCRCRTNVEGIYAIGDVAESRQYAHLASRMGIVAADNATGQDTRDDRTVIPAGIYTHPEAACVGMSEKQARDRGADVRVVKFPYSASGMAQAYNHTQGWVKIIAGTELGDILGASVVGLHANDVMQEIVLAMRNELTVEELGETIHPHPSFVEAIGETADAWMQLPLHMIV
jgi:dihydrolipoamide dehydrogenase